MDPNDLLSRCTGFEWDRHNAEKNWTKHRVLPSECEQVFFHRPLLVIEDEKHSEKENRFYALGKTGAERKLFVVFTVRDDKIRVISARNMSDKERKIYELREEEDS